MTESVIITEVLALTQTALDALCMSKPGWFKSPVANHKEAKRHHRHDDLMATASALGFDDDAVDHFDDEEDTMPVAGFLAQGATCPKEQYDALEVDYRRNQEVLTEMRKKLEEEYAKGQKLKEDFERTERDSLRAVRISNQRNQELVKQKESQLANAKATILEHEKSINALVDRTFADSKIAQDMKKYLELKSTFEAQSFDLKARTDECVRLAKLLEDICAGEISNLAAARKQAATGTLDKQVITVLDNEETRPGLPTPAKKEPDSAATGLLDQNAKLIQELKSKDTEVFINRMRICTRTFADMHIICTYVI